jgi:uncharacterized protein (UPF0276 family)
MFAHAISFGGNTATLLEWDDRIPSFEEVHHKALKADQFRDSVICGSQANQ